MNFDEHKYSRYKFYIKNDVVIDINCQRRFSFNYFFDFFRLLELNLASRSKLSISRTCLTFEFDEFFIINCWCQFWIEFSIVIFVFIHKIFHWISSRFSWKCWQCYNWQFNDTSQQNNIWSKYEYLRKSSLKNVRKIKSLCNFISITKYRKSNSTFKHAQRVLFVILTFLLIINYLCLLLKSLILSIVQYFLFCFRYSFWHA